MYDLDLLPFYEIHTLYYAYWKEKEAESKMTEEQKSAATFSRALENSM